MSANNNHFTPEEISKKIEILKNDPTESLTSSIGKTITLGKQSIDEKKDLFAKAFSVVEDRYKLTAILNAWAIAVILQDSLPISQKIIAFRSMLEDPEIEQQLLNDWIKTVYKQMEIPQDLLEFIGLDLKHQDRVSPEMKALIDKVI
jgi:hypothetical protein